MEYFSLAVEDLVADKGIGLMHCLLYKCMSSVSCHNVSSGFLLEALSEAAVDDNVSNNVSLFYFIKTKNVHESFVCCHGN